MRHALALAFAILATPAAAIDCDTRITGLDGWSGPAQAYWTDQVHLALNDRLRAFQATGHFQPTTFTLNGNTAAITSGRFERERQETSTTGSDKVPVSRIDGTEVPVYEIQSLRERHQRERITVTGMTYRLPVRIADLPRGARETLLVDAVCTLEQRHNPPIARAKSVRAAISPPPKATAWIPFGP